MGSSLHHHVHPVGLPDPVCPDTSPKKSTVGNMHFIHCNLIKTAGASAKNSTEAITAHAVCTDPAHSLISVW